MDSTRLNKRRLLKPLTIIGLLALALLKAPSAEAVLTFSVIANIQVGTFCVRPVSVAANSVTNRIYVGTNDMCNNFNPTTVFVIDGNPTSSTFNTVIATVPVGPANLGIAVNTSTNRIFVSNHFGSSGNPTGTVSVIEGTTNTVLTTVTAGCGPTGVAVDPGTNLVYVANGCSADSAPSTVSVIDGVTNTVKTTIQGAFSAPMGVAADTSVSRLFVANSGPSTFTFGNSVAVINTINNLRVTNVPVGNTPEGIAVNSADDVYVTNANSFSVSVIDGNPLSSTANTVIDTVLVGAAPSSAAVDLKKNFIFVTNVGSNDVSVIDGTTNTLIDGPVSVGSRPSSVDVNQATDLAYVANEGSGTVSVIKVIKVR